MLGVDVEQLSLTELLDCAAVGGLEKCVDLAFDAAVKGFDVGCLRCNCCNKS